MHIKKNSLKTSDRLPRPFYLACFNVVLLYRVNHLTSLEQLPYYSSNNEMFQTILVRFQGGHMTHETDYL
jgi:hypothetical protein